MDTTVKTILMKQLLVSKRPYTSHNAHVKHDIDRVSQLDANFAQCGLGRTHEVGNDKKSAALHTTLKYLIKFLVHFLGLCPIIRRAGLFSILGTDKSMLLSTCNIVWMGAVVIAARPLFLV